MLKAIRLSNLALKTFRVDDNKVVEIDGKANKTIINLFKNNKFKNLTYVPNIRAIEKSIFLTLNAKKVFNHLWLAFIKVPIFQYFDLKNYIFIKTDVSSYAIDKVLN